MSISTDGYAAQLAALLPRGLPWPRHPDSVLGRLLAAWSEALARVDARAERLLWHESDPRATVELLVDWERAWGLPDACIGALESDDLRRGALVARITATGDQAPAYYVALAAAVGVPVSIVEYRVHSVDDDTEAALTDDPWAYTWEVQASAVTMQYRSVEAGVDDPLADWSRGAHECLINRLKPAHTHVLFTYV